MKLERLQKILSKYGVMSRRKAEECINSGRIKINGHPAILGQKVNIDKDSISLDGENIEFDVKMEQRYIELYKPRGYVSTLSDNLGRKCITELVSDIKERVYPIGRLDLNSEGLLILTTDGDFANKMMHPRYHISKTYRVTIKGDVRDDQLAKMSSGVDIGENTKTLPCTINVLLKEENRSVLEITIKEGKNRQIRRMCEAVDLEVARLKRISIGGVVRLGMLKPGTWRDLTDAEMRALKGSLKNK